MRAASSLTRCARWLIPKPPTSWCPRPARTSSCPTTAPPTRWAWSGSPRMAASSTSSPGKAPQLREPQTRRARSPLNPAPRCPRWTSSSPSATACFATPWTTPPCVHPGRASAPSCATPTPTPATRRSSPETTLWTSWTAVSSRLWVASGQRTARWRRTRWTSALRSTRPSRPRRSRGASPPPCSSSARTAVARCAVRTSTAWRSLSVRSLASIRTPPPTSATTTAHAPSSLQWSRAARPPSTASPRTRSSTTASTPNTPSSRLRWPSLHGTSLRRRPQM
mmetsp:Transcript_7240/g.19714  ORF Transcript_7240/g.19714 Transcript_7240/m.19714 type:complete len:280 (+) Transcript_7240:983-1822(+)